MKFVKVQALNSCCFYYRCQIYDLDNLAHNWAKTCVYCIADSIDLVWGKIGVILRAMITWSD